MGIFGEGNHKFMEVVNEAEAHFYQRRHIPTA